MDDLYVPFINLYTPKQYINFMRELGFRIHQKINLKNLRDIDHFNHHSSVIVFEKLNRTPKLNNIKNNNLLNKKNLINQLNKKITLKTAKFIIVLFYLKKLLKKLQKKHPKYFYFLCFRTA